MATSVPLTTLVHGLTITTPKEISQIPYDKLLTVLVHGNIYTVETLQKQYGEDCIIQALSQLSVDQLQKLLAEDNLEAISTIIDQLCGIINNG